MSLLPHVLRYLGTLHIVWSPLRRQVIRCRTRLQTMCSVLRYRKIFLNDTIWFGCVYFSNLLKSSIVVAEVTLYCQQDRVFIIVRSSSKTWLMEKQTVLLDQPSNIFHGLFLFCAESEKNVFCRCSNVTKFKAWIRHYI